MIPKPKYTVKQAIRLQNRILLCRLTALTAVNFLTTTNPPPELTTLKLTQTGKI